MVISVEGIRGGQVRSVSDDFLLREVWSDGNQDRGSDLQVEGYIGGNRS